MTFNNLPIGTDFIPASVLTRFMETTATDFICTSSVIPYACPTCRQLTTNCGGFCSAVCRKTDYIKTGKYKEPENKKGWYIPLFESNNDVKAYSPMQIAEGKKSLSILRKQEKEIKINLCKVSHDLDKIQEKHPELSVWNIESNCLYYSDDGIIGFDEVKKIIETVAANRNSEDYKRYKSLRNRLNHLDSLQRGLERALEDNKMWEKIKANY